MEKIEVLKINISEDDHGMRLDRALTNYIPDMSRSRLQTLIDSGHVKPNHGRKYKVTAGEAFEVEIPPAIEAEPIAQNIPLDIVYEDPHLLVINKSSNMVVHPAAGHHDGTLVNALLYYCGDQLSGIGGVKRPGIVHRLDKETSGLMVVAKNDKTHRGLSEQLASRTLKRVYRAIVWGAINPSEGQIATNIGRCKFNRKKMAVVPLGGKEAITDYQRLESYGILASLVECRLQTGRTHQIRVHMAHINNHMIGDPSYGRKSIGKFLRLNKIDADIAEALRSFPRQALHAAEIEFIHPVTKEKIGLKSEMPEDMQELLKMLQKHKDLN